MFFGSRERSLARRRGVVLILILGMLALMALIGVTFATFAGQSLVNSRNFAAGVNWPGSEQLMDYALAQLINDTSNPLSAIRGHSLLRDMYGNDSLVASGRFDQYRHSGTAVTVGSGAATRGLLTALPSYAPYYGAGLVFGKSQAYPVPDLTKPFNFQTTEGINNQNENATEKAGPTYKHPYLQYQTNIPAGTSSPPELYGVDFTKWVVRVKGATGAVAATYEVVEDDASGSTAFSGGNHLLTLAQVDYNDTTNTRATRVYSSPDTQEAAKGTPLKGLIGMIQPIEIVANNPVGQQFVLDGRYMRAFNGPGMSAFNFVGFDSTAAPPSSGFNGAGQPHNNAAFANFRVNGQLLPLAFGPGGDGKTAPGPGNPPAPPSLIGPQSFGEPNTFGMDEDYDACDLENWFLALQSADGSVIIPSFHRPGILTASDWTNVYTGAGTAADSAAIMSMAKILRPRTVDNYAAAFPPDPTPDVNSGKITYDVDNDGDGISDSVWLDLGYPSLRDPRGTTFKPLFSFMVLGLNGRLPLNTAGNLQSRDFQRPLAGPPTTFAEYYPQNYTDGATWSHASHLGYSVNEINPMYALQNAPNLVYGIGTAGTLSSYSQFDNTGYDHKNNPGGIGENDGTKPLGNSYNRILGNAVLLPGGNGTGQNAGVGVDITQLRNILSGTIAPTATGATNDANTVFVGGSLFYLPNSLLDSNDTGAQRSGVTVPGRWGEPNAIPTVLDQGLVAKKTFNNKVNSVYPVYTNAIRAGKSAAFLTNGIFTTGGDGMDDDADSTDFYPFSNPSVIPYALGEGYVDTSTTPPTSYGDAYDAASSVAQPVERIRRFVTPIDPSGNGRVVSWSDGPPINAYDYGNGYDKWGRTSFFRYFRPAGMPKAVAYDPTLANNFWGPPALPGPAYKPNTAKSELSTQIADAQPYNQPMTGGPVLNPSSVAGVPNPPAPIWNPAYTPNPANPQPYYDVTTNLYHGWQSMAAPVTFITTTGTAASETGLNVSGIMPFDWNYGAYPAGYANVRAIPLPYPVINPSTVSGTHSPSTMTPLVNSGQGPVMTVYPPLVGAPPGTLDTVNYLPPFGAPLTTGLTASFFTGSTTQYPTVVGGYPTHPATRTVGKNTVAMPSDGLNKNEADEMNLYSPNPFDMPFGPADLEWLYRLHDVDGAQLTSRLQYLAPISFTNTADGLTRRRLFTTDTWDTIHSSFAPDNPAPASYDFVHGAFTDPSLNYFNNAFAYNSRFNFGVSGSLSAINYGYGTPLYQNPLAILDYPNPVSYPFEEFASKPAGASTFGVVTYPLATIPNTQLRPLAGPSIASRDRKINLNYPLPVSNDPAEPVRQKWIRETYQYFKSILPPQAIDTPQELAQLSQFVVNIVDFRDPDCSNTRFVNTDLIMIPASATQVAQLAFADRPVPMTATVDTAGNTPATLEFVHYPFDPTIYDEQMRAYLPPTNAQGNPVQLGPLLTSSGAALQADWKTAMGYPLGAAIPTGTVEFLVQHGTEYNPLAINEVMAYQYDVNNAGGGGPPTGQYTRLAVEMVNMLTDDGTVPASTISASDMNSSRLDGWDMVVTLDTTGYGRPDPVTGELPMAGLVAAQAYPPPAGGQPTQQFIITAPSTPPDAALNAPAVQPSNAITQVPPANNNANANAPGQFTFNINSMRDMGPGTGTGVRAGVSGRIYYLFSTQDPPANAELPNTVTSGGGIDAMLPANFAMPAITRGMTIWCWLHLRRPANPFDQRPYAYREMVTIDSIRFPYTYVDNGYQSTNPTTAPVQPGLDIVKTASAALVSIERYQPFRGGHLVPPLNATVNTFPFSPPPTGGAAPPYDPTAWGYSEQSTPGQTPAAPLTATTIYYGNNYPGSGKLQGKAETPMVPAAQVLHSLGAQNNPVDAQWDYFPFNDRDFMSPAELLLVPGCPPGLFTKQFVEDNDPYDTNTIGGAQSDMNPFPTATGAPLMTLTNLPTSRGGTFNSATPRTYPYLVDKFYYSAASVAPPLKTPAGFTYPNLVGGWTGDGWYRMFEFVEVPSSANGSIGTVAAGENFDWLRQDLKPGLLNLNLIIDEEVFFGLLDDPRLNDALNSVNINTAPATPTPKLPQIVTQINGAGHPVATYPISAVLSANQDYNTTYAQGRGYTFFSYSAAAVSEQHGLKAAFSDFLKLRAGGSGYLFAWGSGTTGSGGYDYTVAPQVDQIVGTTMPLSPFPAAANVLGTGSAVARERPYRSFMAPDINDTILRPATPPPSQLTFPAATYGPAFNPAYYGSHYSFAAYPITINAVNYYGDPAPYVAVGATVPPTVLTDPKTGGALGYVGDQGIRNSFLTAPSLWNPAAGFPATNYAKFAPITPMRRLFQVPDVYMNAVQPDNNASGAAEYTVAAYQAGLVNANPYYPYKPNQPIYLENLYYPTAAVAGIPYVTVTGMTSNLFAQSHSVVNPGSTAFPGAAVTVSHDLGSGSPSGNGATDNRQHPYFRTEMLQKVMNLTTVRTHQFAVWITIGFFEVLKPGRASLGEPDYLGGEIGLAAGRNIRYRSFFLLDRTRATGFDPSEPGDFRDVVVYRRRIE